LLYDSLRFLGKPPLCWISYSTKMREVVAKVTVASTSNNYTCLEHYDRLCTRVLDWVITGWISNLMFWSSNFCLNSTLWQNNLIIIVDFKSEQFSQWWMVELMLLEILMFSSTCWCMSMRSLLVCISLKVSYLFIWGVLD